MTLEEMERKLGEVLEFLNQKADLDMQNIVIPENYDYVIESKLPTEEDPSWYRLYKSGWIEQGGKIPHQDSSSDVSVVLYKEMLDTNYNFSGCVVYSSNAQTDHREATNELASKTTTGFTKYIWHIWQDFYWQVSGQSAQ